MRWEITKTLPLDGETRERLRFALWPTRIGNYRVWLEFYETTQAYSQYYDCIGDSQYGWHFLGRQAFDRSFECDGF